MNDDSTQEIIIIFVLFEKIFEKNDSLQIQSIETNLHSIEEGHKESISIESDNLNKIYYKNIEPITC